MGTTFLLFYAYKDFSTPLSEFELILVFMVFLVTCQHTEDPIKMKALELYIDFLDTQWQLTPQSVLETGLNSNLSNIRDLMAVLLTSTNE